MIVITGAKTQGVRGRWATRPCAIERILKARRTKRQVRAKIAGRAIECNVSRYAGKTVSVAGEKIKIAA